MSKYRVGFAMTGSYCTFRSVIPVLKMLKDEFGNIIPIMSEKSALTDTRFGLCADFVSEIREICGKDIIDTIAKAEPIGPRGLLDILIVMPCTGNTIAKTALGITDSSVTMAIKAHLRNSRPVLLAVSTNDGLSGNAANIGALLARKHIFFVPFGQDDAISKPTSLTAKFDLVIPAAYSALEGVQLQPILV